MLCLSGFELYSRWVPLSLARELYPLLSLANQCCWSTRQSREPSTELWTFWSAFSTHFPSPEYFWKKNIKKTDPKIKKYVSLKHWETVIGSCVVTRVITRYRTKQEKLCPCYWIENWSWSSALLKSSVWKVPVPNELSWLLRYGHLFGRLISVLKWKGSHKCFIKVRISSYNFSLKSNQLRPWILETENLSVCRCVLYWIFRLIWAQCNFLSRQTTLNDTQRKIQYRGDNHI